jgi:protease YdgD
LDRSGYRAKIVSIVSAGGEQDGVPISIGMELPERVDRLKAALHSGKALSVAQSVDPANAATTLAPAAPGMPGKPGKRIILGGDAGTGARFVSP